MLLLKPLQIQKQQRKHSLSVQYDSTYVPLIHIPRCLIPIKSNVNILESKCLADSGCYLDRGSVGSSVPLRQFTASQGWDLKYKTIQIKTVPLNLNRHGGTEML